MVWIIIVVILIVAFGPIFWLMPSRRERRLSALRQRAYRHGMRVDLRRLPGNDVAPEERVSAGGRPLDTRRERAAYVMPLQGRLRMLPGFRILRGGNGTAAAPGWVFEAGKRPDHPRLEMMLEALAPIVAGLPDDVAALEGDAHSVAAYWLEGPGTTPERVDDLATRLGAAAEALQALDTRLKAGTDPGTI